VTVVGVGIDLVDLERIRTLLAKKGEHAMARFFSDTERQYLATRTDATGHAAAGSPRKRRCTRPCRLCRGREALAGGRLRYLAITRVVQPYVCTG